MDDKRTQSPSQRIADIKISEIEARAYETYIVEKLKQLVEILGNDHIFECLYRLNVFESMMFYGRLRVLEFTCRFLLTKGATDGEQEFHYDLPLKAMRQYQIQTPERLRFFYVVTSKLRNNKKLSRDQLFKIRVIHMELRSTMAFIRAVKDPVKRLLLFIDKK